MSGREHIVRSIQPRRSRALINYRVTGSPFRCPSPSLGLSELGDCLLCCRIPVLSRECSRRPWKEGKSARSKRELGSPAQGDWCFIRGAVCPPSRPRQFGKVATPSNLKEYSDRAWAKGSDLLWGLITQGKTQIAVLSIDYVPNTGPRHEGWGLPSKGGWMPG